MTHEIISHKFREIFLPTMLIAMALNITVIVDASFVATYIGHNGQAALQVLEPLVLLVTTFEWLFGLGGQILSLNKRAEFDIEASNSYFTSALLTTLVISVLIIIVCFLFENQMINLLHPPSAEVVPFVKNFAFYLFIAFPIATILTVISQFIRVDGQPNFASALIIIANIVNISLDYVFLGVFHMGISGASLATLIGYIVGMIFVLKYYFDPKRTFKIVKVKFSTWIKNSLEIIKVGFPGASVGLFDLMLVYIMNLILGGILGTIGLDIYNACVNALLIISIIVVGFAETLSSVVPVYYLQNDFFNIKFIVRRSIVLSLICSIVFISVLWIYPDAFLMFYNLHAVDDSIVEAAIRLYSLSFIPFVIAEILIFYYEGIERTLASTLIAIISTFLGPLVFTYMLYPVIGLNGIWISFALGFILSVVVNAVYVKIAEMKESEYSGTLFIKKDLVEKTRNYSLKSANDTEKTEMLNHLRTLKVSDDACNEINNLIEHIFKSNEENVFLEVLLIDYDEKISINIKDEEKREIIKNNAEFSDNDNISYSEVLGFNNVEYVIKK